MYQTKTKLALPNKVSTVPKLGECNTLNDPKKATVEFPFLFCLFDLPPSNPHHHSGKLLAVAAFSSIAHRANGTWWKECATIQALFFRWEIIIIVECNEVGCIFKSFFFQASILQTNA